jgi:glycosyltransferase involved in cell wall biosynthesis
MRVLFLCDRNPWTLSGGALIRNACLIRALAREHEVELVTADAGGGPVPQSFATTVRGVHRFPAPGAAARAAGALRPGSSYYVSGLVSAQMHRAVAELAASCDFAVADLRMANALAGTRIPYVYNAHNCETALVQRRAAIAPAPLRALLRIEAARLAAIETRFVREAAAVAACSEADRTDLARLAPLARHGIIIVPNGVDIARYAGVRAASAPTGTVLLSGSFDWHPNRVGLEWFLESVLPALQRLRGKWTVRVAGRMQPRFAALLAKRAAVEVSPNPIDMRDELRRAQIVAVPVLASSGTRLRILEAWAAGRPVVTTPEGAFGLDIYDGREARVAREPAAFAQAIDDLLRAPAACERIREAALARVEAFDWDAIGRAFLSDVAPLLAAAGGSSRNSATDASRPTPRRNDATMPPDAGVTSRSA